jgi:hypothetical protein
MTIKASAGLALPFVLLGARPRKDALSGALAAGMVAAGVSLVLFGTAITNMAGALAVQQHFKWIVVSIPSFIAYYAHAGLPDHTTRGILTAATGAAVIALIVRARGGRGWIEGAAGATLIVLATTAWVLPWYLVWALPFVALVRGRTIPAAAVLMSTLLIAMQLDHFVLTHGHHHRSRELHAHVLRHARHAEFRFSSHRAHSFPTMGDRTA